MSKIVVFNAKIPRLAANIFLCVTNASVVKLPTKNLTFLFLGTEHCMKMHIKLSNYVKYRI